MSEPLTIAQLREAWERAKGGRKSALCYECLDPVDPATGLIELYTGVAFCRKCADRLVAEGAAS